MARLKSILPIEGPIGGLSFYKMRDMIVVRQGWGPDKARMRKDPAFARARENGMEFGACAKDSQLLRKAIWPFLQLCRDKALPWRMNKLMFQLKNLDGVSKRGERNAATGIQTTGGMKLLTAFAFNPQALPDRVLKKKPGSDLEKGELRLENFSAKRDLAFPKGATHAELQLGRVKIDFEARTFKAGEAIELSVSKRDAKRDLVVQVPGPGKGKGLEIMVLSIRFLQEANGKLYPLSNHQFNTCGIVGVK